MEFFDLVNISERTMELGNPTTPEKILTAGKYLRLREGSRLIDFGCGFAEPLVLWAEQFGVGGIGIDIRPYAVERARKKVSERGLAGRVEIVQGNAAEYIFEEKAFDAATCIGATFIWGGYRSTIQAMRRAIRPGGRLAIGEPYWLTDAAPPAYVQQEPSFHSEAELFAIAREEGFTFEYLVRSSHDDWDRYEAENWHGLIRWLEENPAHPDRAEVSAHLHRIQQSYLTYGRSYLGWAIYVLTALP